MEKTISGKVYLMKMNFGNFPGAMWHVAKQLKIGLKVNKKTSSGISVMAFYL